MHRCRRQPSSIKKAGAGLVWKRCPPRESQSQQRHQEGVQALARTLQKTGSCGKVFVQEMLAFSTNRKPTNPTICDLYKLYKLGQTKLRVPQSDISIGQRLVRAT